MGRELFLNRLAPFAVGVALIMAIDDLASSSPDAPAPEPAPLCVWNRAWVPKNEQQMGTVHPCLTVPKVRARGFGFVPGTTPAHRERFLRAVSELRPEARRLVDVVDGLVKVRLDWEHPKYSGLASGRRNGRFEVRVAVPRLLAHHGEPGVQYVIAHELGHVIDRVMLDPAAKERLDERIPRGLWCPRELRRTGCGGRPERFAHTFAKWATSWHPGISDRVSAPHSVYDGWGAPLSDLARRVGPPP